MAASKVVIAVVSALSDTAPKNVLLFSKENSPHFDKLLKSVVTLSKEERSCAKRAQKETRLSPGAHASFVLQGVNYMFGHVEPVHQFNESSRVHITTILRTCLQESRASTGRLSLAIKLPCCWFSKDDQSAPTAFFEILIKEIAQHSSGEILLFIPKCRKLEEFMTTLVRQYNRENGPPTQSTAPEFERPQVKEAENHQHVESEDPHVKPQEHFVADASQSTSEALTSRIFDLCSQGKTTELLALLGRDDPISLAELNYQSWVRVHHLLKPVCLLAN